jgi:hypothetical protein
MLKVSATDGLVLARDVFEGRCQDVDELAVLEETDAAT